MVRVIQTNSAGTNAHLIDPGTHEVLAVIEGLPHAHGVAEHPDGLYYYFSNEMHSTLDVVDTRTLEIIEHIPLSGRPNNISISKELRKLYVGIRGAPYTDVIDVDTHEVIKTIRMYRGVHNIYVTEDSRYAVASLAPGPVSPEDPSIEVIDTDTDEIAWGIPVNGLRTRPLAIESNPDGSPRRIFAQASEHHGFFVIDWDTREIVDFISPPSVPLSQINADGRQDGPSHGLEVLADNSAVWDVSRVTQLGVRILASRPGVHRGGPCRVGRRRSGLGHLIAGRPIPLRCGHGCGRDRGRGSGAARGREAHSGRACAQAGAHRGDPCRSGRDRERPTMTRGAGRAPTCPGVPRWRVLVGPLLLVLTACTGEGESAAASVAAATGLDFDFYVSEVEPIFTRPRGGFTLESPGRAVLRDVPYVADQCPTQAGAARGGARRGDVLDRRPVA